MKVLVTGGAGYIGSHIAHQMADRDEEVHILDDLSTGHEWALPKSAKLYIGDCGDKELIGKIIKDNKIESCLHFAAKIEVPESVDKPELYYENNVSKTLRLLQSAISNGLKNFIFSSTAATYGEPGIPLISEETPQVPINPYGGSKLMMERIIQDITKGELGRKAGFKYTILRYFNVAGAREDNSIGQAYPNATHLIKVISKVLTGQLDKITVYGDNYPTPDGTCIRDYIHVDDLALAHLLALDSLVSGGPSNIFNCGYGVGYSVKQVIKAMEKVSGQKIPFEIGPRRKGDPGELVSNASKIRKSLGWKPKYGDIDIICKTALEWEKKFIKDTNYL